MRDVYPVSRRYKLAATLVAGGLLLTACGPDKKMPATSTPVAGSAASGPQLPSSPALPPNNPEFLIGGYDAEGNKLIISSLTPDEQAFYDRQASPQEASQAALQWGCNAIADIEAHIDEPPSDDTPYDTERVIAYDNYNHARSVYEMAEHNVGTFHAVNQFAVALGEIGCRMPEPRFKDVG